MATNYTTKTASLKATTADIRKLAATSVDAGSVQADELTVKNGEGYSSVTDLIDTAVEGAIDAAADALAEAKTELEGKITEAQEAAAISVGRDDNKDYKTGEDEVTKLVKQINFLGEYVNVIPATDNSGKVNVYIGENKSLKGVKSSLTGAPGATGYYSFTNDSYTVTGANKVNYNGIKKAGNTAGYSDVTLKSNTDASYTPVSASSGTSTTIFRTESSDNSIWFRTTINGVVGEIASQPLSADLSSKALKVNNVTLTTTNTVLTADHAKLGKIPGHTETSFTFGFDPDTVVPNGGSIKIEWAISISEPTTWNSVNLMYGTYTETPTASAITAAFTDKVLTDKVSGMQYVTSGSTLNVKVASLENSQKNLTTSLNRLRLVDNTTYDSTNKTDYTLHTFAVKTDGTMTTGMTETSGEGAKSSEAVFAVDKNITTGGRLAAASFEVTGSYWDYDDADGSPSKTLTKATVPGPYYGTVSYSTDLAEKFSKENKRTDADRVAWGSKSDTLFTGDENMIDGRVPAVVQMGKLYHPANTSIVADANGNKPASSTKEAVFYRVIKSSTSSEGDQPKMKLTGSNLNNSNVGIYLRAIKADGTLEPKTWKINAEPSVTDSIGTGIAAAGGVTASQVLFDFNTTLGVRPRQKDGFLLMVVLKSGAPALGTMTFANN